MLIQNNYFRLIGTCYGDPDVGISNNNGNNYALFTLAVKNPSGKVYYIQLVAYGIQAKMAANMCRNGYKVAVDGSILTRQKIDRETGQIMLSTFFIVNNIMIITKKLENVDLGLGKKAIYVAVDTFLPEEKMDIPTLPNQQKKDDLKNGRN